MNGALEMLDKQEITFLNFTKKPADLGKISEFHNLVTDN